MTPAERIAKRFSGGRPMNELRTAKEAIWTAAALKQQLGAALEEEGLNPEDCTVHIAALTPDLSMLLTHKFTDGTTEGMEKLHARVTSVCSIMVGLIFAIEETDAAAIKKFGRKHKVLGAKPFLNTKVVSEALQHRIDSDDMVV